MNNNMTLKDYFMKPFRIISFLYLCIATGGVAYADAGTPNGKDFIAWSRAERSPDLDKYQTFCSAPLAQRNKYLAMEQEKATSDKVSAYKYGAILAFAPCMNNQMQKAKIYLKQSANAGYMPANYLLGIILMQSKYPQDYITAKKMLKTAALYGLKESYYLYSLTLSNLRESDEKMDFLSKSAAMGDMRAQHDKAIHYLTVAYKNDEPKQRKIKIFRTEDSFKYIFQNAPDKKLRFYALSNLIVLWQTYSFLNANEADINKMVRLMRNSPYYTGPEIPKNPASYAYEDRSMHSHMTRKEEEQRGKQYDIIEVPDDVHNEGQKTLTENGMKIPANALNGGATSNAYATRHLELNTAQKKTVSEFDAWQDAHSVSPIGSQMY